MLLTPLEKVEKEQDELRASNSQLKLCIKDWKAPIPDPKGTCITPVATGTRYLKTKTRDILIMADIGS